ncbi:hypothetical protein GpartN1_g1243.t1 [Galdieria partita]|uniref:Thioredoxin domain-containing protein n=1 Tax=Galdieria partita TaxID=83374 RepID=A0A9C7PT33_9RHOD|nr:hypothetical protein GpartN1_g1243.t1 [Galdieria partita]
MWYSVFLILFVFVLVVLRYDVAFGYIVELTPENFDESCVSRLCLVEFYAPWCSYCQRAETELVHLSQFTDMSNVTISKVDGSRWKLLRKRFLVSGFPSFFLIKETKVYRFVGSHKVEHLHSFVLNLTDAEELPRGVFENPLSTFWKMLSKLEDLYLKSAKWIRNSSLPVYGLAWITCVLLIAMLVVIGCLLNVVGSFRALKPENKRD